MSKDVRELIRTMSQANPLWGAPRIHGELLKLGIDVCQATVAKYMVRDRRPPSQTWRAFLANHIRQIMAADFFVVPTARQLNATPVAADRVLSRDSESRIAECGLRSSRSPQPE